MQHGEKKVKMTIKPTREELLECWITLFKIKDSLITDPADEQIFLSALEIVNKLQRDALYDRNRR